MRVTKKQLYDSINRAQVKEIRVSPDKTEAIIEITSHDVKFLQKLMKYLSSK